MPVVLDKKKKRRKKGSSNYSQSGPRQHRQKQTRNPIVSPQVRTTPTPISSPHWPANKNKRNDNNTISMKRLKNQKYQLKAQPARDKENVNAVVNKVIEKERVITTKKVASITTVANKMSGRLSDIRNRNLVMSDTNKTKLVNQKEKYKIELDRVRNKLEQTHSVAMSEVNILF